MMYLAELLTTTHQENNALEEAYMWSVIALNRTSDQSVFAREAKTAIIIQKAEKIGLNIRQMKKDAELKAIGIDKKIPVLPNFSENENVLLKNIQKKYGSE